MSVHHAPCREGAEKRAGLLQAAPLGSRAGIRSHVPLSEIRQSQNISSWKGPNTDLESNALLLAGLPPTATYYCDSLKSSTLTVIYISLGETLDRPSHRDAGQAISFGQLQVAHAGIPLHNKSNCCSIGIKSCCLQVLICEVCCRAWTEEDSPPSASASPAKQLV